MLDALEKKTFEVNSFYKVLHHNLDSSLCWKSIRRSKGPLRLGFFHLNSIHGENSHIGQSLQASYCSDRLVLYV